MTRQKGNVWYEKPPDQHRRITMTEQEVLALERLSKTVVGASSLERMIDLVFEVSAQLMDCDRVSIAFLEDEGRLVSFYTKASYEPVLLKKGFSQDLVGSSMGEVVRSGRPRVIEDLELYLQEHPDSGSTRLLVSEGVRSSMTCPLLVDDRVVGALFRSSRQAKAFGEREVSLHLVVADLLSQAVDKAWRIEQLERASRAYSEMLGFVSHELKSPLASVVMDAQVLSQGYLGPLLPPQLEKLGSMIRKAEYLLGLIGEYLDLARVESKELTAQLREGVDLWEEVVAVAASIVEPQAQAKKMTLERDRKEGDQVKLRADPQLLKIAVVNLLSNAVKYGDEGGLVRVSTTVSEHSVQLSVWNSGPGFPKEQAFKLFRKWSRLDTPALRQRKGTGVGLYTTWRIAALHAGKISATSEPGSFAQFVLELPC